LVPLLPSFKLAPRVLVKVVKSTAREDQTFGRCWSACYGNPTDAARIRDVIDRGERLPRKSTFFWPKRRTGLVLRPLDLDATEVGSLGRLELLDAGGDHLGEAASPAPLR
jgi:hypothetical protein